MPCAGAAEPKEVRFRIGFGTQYPAMVRLAAAHFDFDKLHNSVSAGGPGSSHAADMPHRRGLVNRAENKPRLLGHENEELEKI